MKIAIVGSRTFDNYSFLTKVLDKIREKTNIKTIVSGGAKGADYLGAKYAKEHKIELIEFIPEWDKYGKGAGFKRNLDIVENCDYLIAFWDGKSKGTLHSINYAQKINKPHKVFQYIQ